MNTIVFVKSLLGTITNTIVSTIYCINILRVTSTPVFTIEAA